MKCASRLIALSVAPICGLGSVQFASADASLIQPLAWYRLGEDDPGAAPGLVGDDPTLDHTIHHFDLTRAGSPHYSADTPANAIGSKLAMKFFNFTGPLEIPVPLPNYYERQNGVVPLTGGAITGFGLECWVKSSPLGQGNASGYSLIAYAGDPFIGGVGFFQHDKDYVVRIGKYEKVLAPASSTTWTHLGFFRNNRVNDFTLDGMDQADMSTDAQSAPSFTGGAFFIGGFGNPLSASPLPPRYLFNGLVDEARLFAVAGPLATASGSFLIANVPRDLSWTASGGSAWNNTDSNWQNGSNAAVWCDTAPDNATFGSGAEDGNVAVNQPIHVGEIIFSAGAPTYAIAGAASVNIAAPLGEGVSAQQSASINVPVSLLNDQDWSVAAGATVSVSAPVSGSILNKSGDGTLALATLDTNGLAVKGGIVRLSPPAGASVANHAAAVSVASGGELDLVAGRLITSTPLAEVTSLVQSGRNAGAWSGSGIVTSSASDSRISIGTAHAGEVLAIADAATGMWGGRTVNGSDTLVAVTWAGDANLDGKINIDDYGRIDANIGIPGASGWCNGDFNYDGKINIDDYGIIDGNIGVQGPPLLASTDVTEGLTAVPEPGTASLLLTMFLLTPGIRARHRAKN